MGENQDPGSGINIPDPQHCLQGKDRPLYENEKLANFCLVAVIGNRQGQKKLRGGDHGSDPDPDPELFWPGRIRN
jgi:hypothetical protein